MRNELFTIIYLLIIYINLPDRYRRSKMIHVAFVQDYKDTGKFRTSIRKNQTVHDCVDLDIITNQSIFREPGFSILY